MFEQFPIRQDITVIEAEKKEKKEMKLNWFVYEYQGCEVFKIVKEMENLSVKEMWYAQHYPKDRNGEPLYHKPIIKQEDLKEGDEVIVWDWRGIIKSREEGELYVDCGGSYGTLEFDNDERHCWVCSCMVNKGVEKLMVSKA